MPRRTACIVYRLDFIGTTAKEEGNAWKGGGDGNITWSWLHRLAIPCCSSVSSTVLYKLWIFCERAATWLLEQKLQFGIVKLTLEDQIHKAVVPWHRSGHIYQI